MLPMMAIEKLFYPVKRDKKKKSDRNKFHILLFSWFGSFFRYFVQQSILSVDRNFSLHKRRRVFKVNKHLIFFMLTIFQNIFNFNWLRMLLKTDTELGFLLESGIKIFGNCWSPWLVDEENFEFCVGLNCQIPHVRSDILHSKLFIL